MRKDLNKLFSWIVTGAIVFYLCTGGWRTVLHYIPGFGPGPQIPAGLGGVIAQPPPPELLLILNRMGVTSRGMVQGMNGTELALAWPQGKPMLGPGALEEAKRRRVLRGYNLTGHQDVRNLNNQPMIVASYVIW